MYTQGLDGRIGPVREPEGAEERLRAATVIVLATEIPLRVLPLLDAG